MRLDGQQASSNVEDRRGIGAVGGGLGVGGIVIAVIAYFLGFDPAAVLDVAEQVAPQSQSRSVPKGAPSDAQGQFVSKFLGSTEEVWSKVFQQSNRSYQAPTLVLFDGQVRSACGMGQSAMGPFYCPGDAKIYIDLAFLRELQARLGAPGEFAQAYVIAHEVGHHVQQLTGTFEKMEAVRARGSQAETNRMSVRLELQADCYAGVWGHHAGNMNQLDPGDIAQGLNAASAVGDDRMQKRSQDRVVPESFTHGSSEQRAHWFKRGLDSGQPKDCDTFTALSP